MFGFGKKKKQHARDAQEHEEKQVPVGASPSDGEVASEPFSVSNDSPRDTDVVSDPGHSESVPASSQGHEASGTLHSGETSGPYDGDKVNIEDFDFSDLSPNILNLGSMIIVLPQKSQVQVEMGEDSPKMLHILTEFGRLTPIAFAAPKSSGLWKQALVDIADDLRQQGFSVTSEHGPWGEEVVGQGDGVTIRVIGVDGSRWMLRFTLLSAPQTAEQLTQLGREVMAHTFVYRGQQAILAGSMLPVLLPKEVMDQLMAAMQQGAGQPGTQEG